MKEELKFEELGLSENIQKALTEHGYLNATKIQASTIPTILQGQDLVGQSQTGTGKTASFGLPIINKIDKNLKAVQAIVLCPTRELSVQVAEEMRKFTKYEENIKILAVYGGQGIERQIQELKRGVKIVIGTPGRVMDHLRRKTLKLDNVKTVVLDEADEMLSMGFEEDIETILKDVPEDRQTVLFSATMSPRVLNITRKYLRNPKNIRIKEKELTVSNIEQISLDVKEAAKDMILMRLLEVYTPKKCIVFCNTKRKVDKVLEELKSNGFKVEGIHSDIKQMQREKIMKKLKEGQIQILVGTDVIARGIDIQDLELVINYDVPQEEEYYVHRIGRTGRNGGVGKAFTFVVGREKNKIYSIQRYAHTKIAVGKIPTLAEVLDIKNKLITEKIQKYIDKDEFIHEEIVEKLIEENNPTIVAKALATMLFKKTLRTVNTTENRGEKNSFKNETKERTKNNPREAEVGYVKLFISVGKKDDVKAKDIVGAIATKTAISGNEIGKIRILDNFSFVEIPKHFVNEIVETMKNEQIKGKDIKIEVSNG